MVNCASIANFIEIHRFATLPGKPGEPRKVIGFENWPKKSGNLKIDQKVREFHKIDWLAITNLANFTPMLETECG